jgi:phosphonopyruvate decarboxylase
MISPQAFVDALVENDIKFFAGVPDSLLKDLCACISDTTSDDQHIITANEGAAIACVSGYHLATGKVGLVYMQNSGLGNAINPLVSLVDPEVYKIPLLLIIGWRGEPGVKDEPQHIKQGKITLDLLDTIGVQYEVIDSSTEDIKDVVSKACKNIKSTGRTYAFVIREKTFGKYRAISPFVCADYPLERESAIKAIVNEISADDVIVSTTGKTSRELYEYRVTLGQGHQNDFLTVGSMGHCSQIAMGVALQKKGLQVFCIDGDGSVIMHMGSLAISGKRAPANFKHIVINNGAHDSVGGQKTVGFEIDLVKVADACGYRSVYRAESKDELVNILRTMKDAQGPSFLEVRVKLGSREDLGRPKETPVANKAAFMEALSL